MSNKYTNAGPSMIYKGVGRYTVQEGDTLSAISVKLYGDVHKAHVIHEANPDSSLEAGSIIDIPNFGGVVVVAQQGEQFPSLHRRAFNNPAAAEGALEEFFKWNGKRTIEAGEEVFFVDLRRKSYGY